MLSRLTLPALIGLSTLPQFGQGAAGSLSKSYRADLLSVYQAALQNDPQLSAARHAFQGQAESVPQALSGLLPNLSVGTEKRLPGWFETALS